MSDSLGAITNLLSCPDDGDALVHRPEAFVCKGCGRRFPILAGNLAEILPSRPFELPRAANLVYRNSYIGAFEQTLSLSEDNLAWGAEETVSESWARKRYRQVATVQPLITRGTSVASSVLCDIAAGAGYYTFAYAREFRFVLHCDLSAANLNYAWHKARARGVSNIIFIRSDYFAPPFQRSLDRVLCLDTLIRGGDHESVLLRAIAGSLTNSGSAVVDFHNWWHNPVRRLGLLAENFCGNHSYSRREAERLLRTAGVTEFTFRPFRQEFGADAPPGKVLSRLVPPTRLIYLFRVPYESRSRPRSDS